jgi:hypothetical protein
MSIRKSWLILLSVTPLLVHANMDDYDSDDDTITYWSIEEGDDHDADEEQIPPPPQNRNKQQSCCKPAKKPCCKPAKKVCCKPVQKPCCKPKPVCCEPKKPSCCQVIEAGCCDQPTMIGITGEYLFWSAFEDGLDFAVDGIVGFSTAAGGVVFPISTTEGQVHGLPQKWNSGVRVAIDLSPSCKPCWNVDLEWTWYQTRSKRGVTTRQAPIFDNSPGPNPLNPDGLYTAWITPGSGGNAIDTASAKWKLQYNTLDLNLRRMISFGSDFKFNPSIGLRGAWIHQNLNIFTTLMTPGDDFPQFSGTNTLRNKNDFNAIGFRTGFDTAFYLTPHFSIFGDAYVSLLMGKFHVKQTHIANALFFGVVHTTADVKNNFSSLKTALEATLGLRWEQTFCEGQYQFEAHAGYEYLAWLSQNQMIRFTDIASAISTFFRGGDLFLQGLTVGAGFKF